MQKIDLSEFRWPAEWEPHEATWLTWPVNPDTWPGLFERVHSEFADVIAAIACFEPVNLIVSEVDSGSATRLIDTACAEVGAGFPVHLEHIPVNDSWCRDYGPIFLNACSPSADLPQVIVDWEFNAWGGKYPPWDLDNRVPTVIADRLQIPRIATNVFLEGGAIEGNGQGLVITTESCLLNPSRNPELGRRDMESLLHRYLGASDVIWLPGHGIPGDDTDGHIDQLARFTAADRVLAASSADDPEAGLLRANRRALEGHAGISSIQDLPTPRPLFFEEHRIPASYCNFVICNGGVVVPTFRDPADELALGVIQAEFPDRRVVSVDSTTLSWGLGSFHCLSQQQPRIVPDWSVCSG